MINRMRVAYITKINNTKDVQKERIKKCLTLKEFPIQLKPNA